MRSAMSSGRRLARKPARRLSRLAAALLLAPAVAGADPPTTATARDVEPTASEASPSPSAHSAHSTQTPGPGERRAALRPAGPRAASRRHRQLGIPTRRSVRAHIESIDPTVWLRRYGTVERRQLPPCERCDLESGVHLEGTPTDSQ